ncbi:hypothetical protein LIA77_07327 [Sarocladium implicatum]|nr:hypothetical protein LIA77_07327 [Sarocladium implicatum]
MLILECLTDLGTQLNTAATRICQGVIALDSCQTEYRAPLHWRSILICLKCLRLRGDLLVNCHQEATLNLWTRPPTLYTHVRKPTRYQPYMTREQWIKRGHIASRPSRPLSMVSGTSGSGDCMGILFLRQERVWGCHWVNGL